jgi:Spy/CpxP family protein refolding chaperone
MKKVVAMLLVLYFLTQSTAMAAREGRDGIERGMLSYGKGYDSSSLTANSKLKLTAQQATELRDLSEKYAQDVQPIREQLHNLRRELKAEWLKTEPDRGRIQVMQGDAVKLRERMRATFTAYRTDLLKILTPEQQTHMPQDGR